MRARSATKKVKTTRNRGCADVSGVHAPAITAHSDVITERHPCFTVDPKPWEALPEPSAAHPRPREAHPKASAAHPEPREAHPEPWAAHPEPSEAHPGPSAVLPEPREAHPKPIAARRSCSYQEKEAPPAGGFGTPRKPPEGSQGTVPASPLVGQNIPHRALCSATDMAVPQPGHVESRSRSMRDSHTEHDISRSRICDRIRP